jgi:hypothetical protein
MFLVSKPEMVHRRERLAKRIGNLSQRRYLPVEVPAKDNRANGMLGLTTEIDPPINGLFGESECGTVEPEVFCCVNKLLETWDGKCELVEEFKMKLLEARCGNPMDKCIQISANTTEPEMVKIRKCDERDDRRMRELPLCATVGNRVFKEN